MRQKFAFSLFLSLSLSLSLLVSPSCYSQSGPRPANVLAEIQDKDGAIEAKIEALAQKQFEISGKKLSEGFSREIMEEVGRKAQSFLLQKDDEEGLADLRHLPFITIDGDESKDLDQALYIQKLPDGGYQVYYAIADASSFVEENSSLDKEAADRTLTTYLPHKNYPLLPREISENLASLNEGGPRRALVGVVTLDKDGNKIHQDFTYGLVVSQKKASYRTVQEFFDQGEKGPHAGKVYTDSLVAMKEVGEKRQNLAKARHSLTFPGTELRLVKNHSDKEDVPSWKVLWNDQYKTEEWNAQISVLLNNAAGDFIREKGFKSIHRSQDGPTLAKLQELCRNLFRIEKNNQRVKALCLDVEKTDVATFVAKLSQFAETLDPAHRENDKLFLSQVLFTNSRAEYSAEKIRHDGLKIDCYNQYTAPMRRHTDIIIHRILKALIKNEVPPYQNPVDLKTLASRANKSAERETKIRRGVERLAQNLVLKNEEDQILEARVYSSGKQGLNVVFKKYPFSYRIDTRDLEIPSGEEGRPWPRLGDSIQLRVGEIDFLNDKIKMTLVK